MIGWTRVIWVWTEGAAVMADSDAGTTPAPGEAGASPTTNDGPLNAGGMKALESERRARREAEQRARQAEDRLAGIERDRLRETVASSKGVPAELLAGDDEASLTASADALLRWREPAPDPYRRTREKLTPDPGAGGAGAGGPTEDLGAIADRVRF
jgi:hypothetical protein